MTDTELDLIHKKFTAGTSDTCFTMDANSDTKGIGCLSNERFTCVLDCDTPRAEGQFRRGASFFILPQKSSFLVLPNNCNMDQIDSGWISAFGEYYFMDGTSTSYNNANLLCQGLGGHLAIFKTQEERNRIQALGSEDKSTSFLESNTCTWRIFSFHEFCHVGRGEDSVHWHGCCLCGWHSRPGRKRHISAGRQMPEAEKCRGTGIWGLQHKPETALPGILPNRDK